MTLISTVFHLFIRVEMAGGEISGYQNCLNISHAQGLLISKANRVPKHPFHSYHKLLRCNLYIKLVKLPKY